MEVVRQKKIFFFLAVLNSGGAQKVLITLSNEIAKLKSYDVSLVAGNASGSLLGLLNPQVKLIDLKVKKISESIITLSKLLRKEKPDLLVSTQLQTNLVAIISTRLSRRVNKVIIREATTPSVDYENYSGLKKKILYRLARRIFKTADGAIAVSKGAFKDFKKFYNLKDNQSFLSYNPVINQCVFDKANEQNFPISFEPDVPILLTVGRVDPTKDLETLVNGFAMARSKKKMQLLILGSFQKEDEYYKKLQEIISSKKLQGDICFIGFDINPYKWFKKADIFLFTTKLEGLPGSLIQALALECKIITSDFKSGLEDVLDNGRFGKVFPQGRHDVLSELILDELNSPIKIDIGSRKEHFQKFSFDSACESYLNIFNKVLNTQS